MGGINHPGTDSTGESRRKKDHLHLKSKAAQVVKPDPQEQGSTSGQT